jgi:hypothetical protein
MLAAADEMLALATETNATRHQCNALYDRASALIQTGDLDGTEAMAQELERLSRDTRYAVGRWAAAAILAQIAILSGRFDEAAGLIAEEQRFIKSAGESGLIVSISHQISLARLRGDTREAIEVIRQMIERLPLVMLIYAGNAELAAREERIEDLRSMLDDWWTSVQPVIPAQFRLQALTYVAKWFAAAGNATMAADVYAELAPHAGRWPYVAETQLYGIDHALGWCAIAMRDLDTAEAHLRDALAFYDRAGALPLWTHAALDLAAIDRIEAPTLDRTKRIAAELDLDGFAATFNATT